jgi:hypothetical protein
MTLVIKLFEAAGACTSRLTDFKTPFNASVNLHKKSHITMNTDFLSLFTKMNLVLPFHVNSILLQIIKNKSH